MQIQKFSAGTVERIGCVMKITYTTNETLSLDDMKGITIAREKLFGDSEYCSLVDLSKDLLSLTPEARKYVDQNNQIQRLRIAEVLLVKNFGQKLGIATYVKIFRTKDKIKVMTDELEAMEWLNLQFVNHSKNLSV